MAHCENLEQLKRLQEQYQRVRNKKLATGIIIRTLVGDMKINNGQVVTAVLDFLTREVGEQIKQQVNG